MRLIDSEKNNLFRQLMAQGSSREFKRTNWIVIEGLRQIQEALQAKANLEYLIFSDDEKGEKILKDLTENSADILSLLGPDQLINLRSDLFHRLSDTKTPQGVLAILQPKCGCLTDIKQMNSLVLIDVQDPGNVGTLIRCADAFNVRQVLVLGATASPWLAKTLRAAMGSIFHLDIIEEQDELLALAELKKKGIELLALDISGQDIRKLERQKECFGLLLGNEGSGLSEEIINTCDRNVRIEMPGQAESLNVAIAGAIALYELSR